MTHRAIHACVLFSLSAALFGCGAADPVTESEHATESDPFSTLPGEPNHEDVTAAGLSFLRPDVLTAVQAADVASDVEFVLVNANHFDDCNFSGGSDVVRRSQAEAVAQLNPSLPPVEADLLAIRAFGRALHAVQDFYAHTNWVELGGEVLVDDSLTAFPTLRPYSTIPSTGFVVVQGAKPPKRTALARDEDAAYPESAVVKVKIGKAWSPGLISGTVDYEPGNFCPRPVAMTHDELNKDKTSNADRVQQYEAAKALAILQTEHEWCRLRALTFAQWGDAGVARLDAWVSPGATTPACE